MREFSEFTEEDGIVTAIPQSANNEAVRFDASIVERRDEEEIGNWEELVSELMDYDLGEALEIDEDGQAVIDRDQAVGALLDADESEIDASTEWQATAVLEFLDRENVVEVDDAGQVTVLKPLDQIAESDYPRMYNNWAAMFDTCIDRIDYAHDRVEEAKERFENRERETEKRGGNVDPVQRQRELEQKMQNLVGSRSPSELSGEDRERFKQLREQYHFYENLEETKNTEIGEAGNRAEELGTVMEKFEAMRGVMVEKRESFRELALGEAIFPEDLVELSEQYAGLLSSISGVMEPEEKMEEESDDEFFENLGTDDELDEVTEQAESIADQPLTQQS
ncbi:hypothetical protein RYH80_08180 [Halobaculum sp. MBLA0147]|uniref:hypothetical protein n=1 Tax=Halobaculum sp. MBLA0147 TaxID=3079934 RepID=UPI003523A919